MRREFRPRMLPRRLALPVFCFLTSGCASTTLISESGADGARGRQFRIECIELEQCKQEATAACGSPYQVVSEWHNTIPGSELPGLNEQSRPKEAREWNAATLPRRTGIESDDPMPLSSIVVACNA